MVISVVDTGLFKRYRVNTNCLASLEQSDLSKCSILTWSEALTQATQVRDFRTSTINQTDRIPWE